MHFIINTSLKYACRPEPTLATCVNIHDIIDFPQAPRFLAKLQLGVGLSAELDTVTLAFGGIAEGSAAAACRRCCHIGCLAAKLWGVAACSSSSDRYSIIIYGGNVRS